MTISQKVLNLQALSSSLDAGAAKGGCLGRGEAASIHQRRRNDDKNNFWEVESKGGVGRGFAKGVNRGPTLKFYCRPKALERQHFGKSHFYCRCFFPGNTVTIILDTYPPAALQGLDWRGGAQESEKYCRREFLSFRRLLIYTS